MQNRVQLAQAQLPSEVQQEGLVIRAASSNFVLAVNLYSPTNKYDQVFISNYTYMQLQQQIARIPGVGNTQIFGQRQYAMRIWLNPVRMTALGMAASDVIAAIQSQNIQVAAGQIGQPPVTGSQQQQLTVLAPGNLAASRSSRTSSSAPIPNGGVVRIRDIAKVELAAQQYTSASALDGTASATLAIYQAPGANALAVASAVEQQMQVLSKQFPPGLSYAIVYNATNFVTRQHLRDSAHAGDHVVPRRRRGLCVPAGLAGHADPGHRHSGFPDRRVRGALRARLFRQYRRSVRDRAGDHIGCR